MIVVRRADADDLAEIEDQQPLDDGIQRVQHMLDPDDRHAARMDGADGGNQLTGIRPRSGHRRSRRAAAVSARVASARASSSRLRSAATGCPAGHWRLSMSPVSTRISAQRSATSASGRRRAEGSGDQQIFEHRQLLERLRDLECAPHARQAARHRRRVGHLAADESDAAGIDGNIAGDQIEQRRLARAVRPDNAKRLAFAQRQSSPPRRPSARRSSCRRLFERQDRHRWPHSSQRSMAGPARAKRRPRLVSLSRDRLPSCRRRNVRRRLVVGDDQIVAATVLQPPLAADERRLGDVLGRKWRQVRAVPGDRPDQRVELGRGDRLRNLFALRSDRRRASSRPPPVRTAHGRSRSAASRAGRSPW